MFYGVSWACNFLVLNGDYFITLFDPGVSSDWIFAYQFSDDRRLSWLAQADKHHDHDQVSEKNVKAYSGERDQGSLPDGEFAERFQGDPKSVLGSVGFVTQFRYGDKAAQ